MAKFFDTSKHSVFGDIKIDKPTTEGLKAAIDADDQFTHAGDEENVDIYFHKAFDESFFNDDPFENIFIDEDGDIPVDPNTVPIAPEEADQFETEEDREKAENMKMTPSELVKDEPDGIDESFNCYWNDLY